MNVYYRIYKLSRIMKYNQRNYNTLVIIMGKRFYYNL